jgi:anti-anti-sigma factor
MAEQTSRLKVTRRDDVVIAELADRKILDEVNIAQIGEQLYNLTGQQDSPKLVLDFSSVSHMSSSALGMLITLNKRLVERKGHLRLCCIQPSIQEVFRITRLNEILEIHETRQEAVASLK